MSTPTEIWTVKRVLDWTTSRFTEKKLSSPRLDAELLLVQVLGGKRVDLYTRFDRPLEAGELTAYRELIKRRLAGESVAYLLGRRAFHAIELAVDARVLVPRPETEHLVDAALDRLRSDGESDVRVLDIGTGSGAIALAIKTARPSINMTAIDRSPDALAVARRNGEKLALDVRWLLGDVYAPIGDERFDVIVSNPPYIPSGDIPGLPLDVRREPHAALDGGPDGLSIVNRIIDAAPAHLLEHGWLLLELGEGQAATVIARMRRVGFGRLTAVRDYAGIDRCVVGQLGAVEESRGETEIVRDPEPIEEPIPTDS